ncbi:MAG: hypothetical protein Q8O64_00995 [Sideroxyarcus sp.]|nr:hypothetical protein [Sideroxyarcus sp.]
MLAMSGSPSRLRIYDLRINGRILCHHWVVNQLNQLNQLHNYTAPDVNMLHIAESSAENNKIKGTGVDFISALLLPSKKFDSEHPSIIFKRFLYSMRLAIDSRGR